MIGKIRADLRTNLRFKGFGQPNVFDMARARNVPTDVSCFHHPVLK